MVEICQEFGGGGWEGESGMKLHCHQQWKLASTFARGNIQAMFFPKGAAGRHMRLGTGPGRRVTVKLITPVAMAILPPFCGPSLYFVACKQPACLLVWETGCLSLSKEWFPGKVRGEHQSDGICM